LLFTDGLIDAWNEQEESFGEWNVVQVAQERRGVPAVQLMESLLAAASNHCGGHFQDDASVVIVKAI
jgi:serine phosphatase RsbU (regulator of sigma subunit)